MQQRWAALALMLGLGATQPADSAAQGREAKSPGRKVGTLGQSYSNPFSTEMLIPFTIDDCEGPAPRAQHRVSLRIYNVLAQLVGTAALRGSGDLLLHTQLVCGQYVAQWDGRLKSTGKPVAPGVYVYELVVNGQRTSRKMIVGP